MLERVAEIITRYSMFETGQRVGVAVSGGADSVCLLHVLVELAPRWNLHLSVLHLDHQLRGDESREDARFVEKLASSLGLRFHMGQSDVALLAHETAENLEQAARNERRKFFADYLRSGKAARIALGHTRSDQAETVLFRFLRGSGTAGLAGILPVTKDGFVRPLIDIDRATISQYLRDRNISWREDSSNAELGFARNRIRHELLPALAREWNPAIAETLVHTAEWARDEELYWQAEIDRLAVEHIRYKPPAVFMNVDGLNALPAAAARRLIRRGLELVRGDLLGVDYGHVASVLALAAQLDGDGRLQVPGVDVFRSFEWLRLAPPGLDKLENRNFRVPAPVPGTIELPGTVLTLQLIENKLTTQNDNSRYNGLMGSLDWSRISGPLEVRNWRPGDQYQPAGCSGEQKIKLLFQQARIPLWERRNWPIVTAGDAIIWTRRFGPAACVAANSETPVVLEIRETAA